MISFFQWNPCSIANSRLCTESCFWEHLSWEHLSPRISTSGKPNPSFVVNGTLCLVFDVGEVEEDDSRIPLVALICVLVRYGSVSQPAILFFSLHRNLRFSFRVPGIFCCSSQSSSPDDECYSYVTSASVMNFQCFIRHAGLIWSRNQFPSSPVVCHRLTFQGAVYCHQRGMHFLVWCFSPYLS